MSRRLRRARRVLLGLAWRRIQPAARQPSSRPEGPPVAGFLGGEWRSTGRWTVMCGLRAEAQPASVALWISGGEDGEGAIVSDEQLAELVARLNQPLPVASCACAAPAPGQEG